MVDSLQEHPQAAGVGPSMAWRGRGQVVPQP
jgi:hypothetical protein